mgnify:CR=1 FL=1
MTAPRFDPVAVDGLRRRLGPVVADPGGSPFLAGMEKRDSTIEGGFVFDWKPGKYRLSTAAYTDLLGRYYGQQASTDFSRTWTFNRYQWGFTPSIGAVWQSRNDVQIPNDDTGTRFSLVDVVGTGPWNAGRIHLTWNINERHGLRAAFAEADVVLARTALVGMPFEPHAPVRVVGQLDTMARRDVSILGAQLVGVEVEIDNVGEFAAREVIVEEFALAHAVAAHAVRVGSGVLAAVGFIHRVRVRNVLRCAAREYEEERRNEQDLEDIHK